MLWRENELAFRHMRLNDMRESLVIFMRRMRGLFGQPFIEQITQMVERLLASTLAIGTVASLGYARTLTDTALLLIGQPLGYVVLAQPAPDKEDAARHVIAFARPLLGIGIPASLFLVIFAPDIVRLILARGAFNAHAVALTAGALRGISAGLWATTLGWIVVRMVIAAGERITAARIIMAAFFVNILADLVLAYPFGALGLGLGEGVRGVVLLGGALIAMRSGLVVMGLMVRILPFAVVLTAAFLMIANSFDQSLVRVSLGSAALAIAVGAWFVISAPDILRIILQRRRQPS